MKIDKNLTKLSEDLVKYGKKKGADQVEVMITDTSDFSASILNGKIEKLTEAGSKSAAIKVIKDQKVVNVSSSDLNTDTLHGLIDRSVKKATLLNPDVIVIGEMRNLDTISMAISAAETGHLVIGTMSTFSAPKTIDRIIDAYPPNEQNQIRAMLGESFRAVITQRLIPGADEKNMALASEILIGTVPMSKLIRDGKTFQIPSMMQTGKSAGMQIMDECILSLLKEGKISAQSAQKYANDPKIFDNSVKKETK